MQDSFTRRLEHGARLSADDRTRLDRLVAGAYPVQADEDIVSEGDRPPACYVVLEGLAGTYKLLADGSRQIFQFMLPGDSCDMHRDSPYWRDNSLTAFVPSRMVRILPDEVDEIASEYPNLARALWWAMLSDQAVMRERIVSLGRRTADKRLAHLFCELRDRMGAVDRVETNGDGFAAYDFPVTQPELADAVGLTAVHVNRTLQQLRDADLVAFRLRRVTIMDGDRLAALAGYDGRYLQLKDYGKSRAVMRSA